MKSAIKSRQTAALSTVVLIQNLAEISGNFQPFDRNGIVKNGWISLEFALGIVSAVLQKTQFVTMLLADPDRYTRRLRCA
jgi:hypothetical protein